jgi:1-acyl-sn-glycerol-3-phosphate acyltransferase
MLRTIAVIVVLFSTMIVLGFVATVTSLIYPRSYMTVRLGRVWSGLILWVAGIRIRYEGAEHASAHVPCVFMANHQSHADIWAVLRVVPAPTMFAAKKSLFGVPGLGWSMAASGFALIDRTNRASAIRSLSEAADKVRGGRPLVLFPEGTRSRDGRLGPFKKGPFHLALEAGVPVVPVAISGSGKTLPPGTVRICPGVVTVRFAPPVDPQPYLPDDLEGLMAAVREAIARRLDPSEAESAAGDPALDEA